MIRTFALFVATLFCVVGSISQNLAKDYIVQTTKAPVWTMQNVTSVVVAYLDKGDVPFSELDTNDPQWVYVEKGDIKGWAHILSLRHYASEETDLDLADGSFRSFLEDNGVEADVIEKTFSGSGSSTPENNDNDFDSHHATTPTDITQPSSPRGLTPMYIYIINEDVECPVNEQWAPRGNMISMERTSETFPKGLWFPTESPMPEGVVLMDQGKGFDVPPTAYHLMTKDEYLAYMNEQLVLKSNYELGSLRLYLEDHDIAQSGGWDIDFKQHTRTTLGDLWPILIPVVVLIVIFLLSVAIKGNPMVWAYSAIADLAVLLYVAFQYLSIPEKQFNDYGGLAWVVIGLITLIVMAIILFISWGIGNRIMNHYNVELSLKSFGIGFGIGLLACILVHIVMVSLLGYEKNTFTELIVCWVAVVVSTIGMVSFNLLRQNKAMAMALPALFTLWTIALVVAALLAAVVFFVAFAIVLWAFFSGNLSGKDTIKGLVSSRAKNCGACSLYGTMQCPRTSVSPNDKTCDRFKES